MKKVLMVVVVTALIISSFCVSTLAADWTEFGTGSDNNSITDAETPASAEEAELIFKASVKDSSSWDANSNILVVGDYIYVGNGTTILKLDKEGNEKGSATLSASMSSFAPYIAYADGTLFAYVNDGTNGFIEAVNATTMLRVWVSEGIAGMNGFSPITISGGSLYIAVSGYDFSSYAYTPGFVIGMTISDDNTSSQDEVKANTFVYDSGQSYYWNGVALSGSVAIVGSQEGLLETINTTTGAVIDSYDATETITSSVTYVGGVAYFGTASGLGSITVQADGTIVDASYTLVNLGSKVNSTPIVSGTRIYAGTGDFMGGTGLAVIDSLTMTNVYSAQIAGVDSYSGNEIAVAGIQGTPVLTTAYTGNCLYFSINAKPGAVTMIKDADGQTEADITTIFTPEAADQNATACSFVADEDGTLYYTNDSGYLFAVGKTEEEPSTGGVTNPKTGDNNNTLMLVLAGAILMIVLAFVAKKVVASK